MPNMSPKKNEMPSQAPEVRARNFDEVALGYTEEQAIDILGLTRPEGRAITDAEGATSSTTQYQEVPLDSL